MEVERLHLGWGFEEAVIFELRLGRWVEMEGYVSQAQGRVRAKYSARNSTTLSCVIAFDSICLHLQTDPLMQRTVIYLYRASYSALHIVLSVSCMI